MPDDLTGRVALVTGGGRGIGLNVARELADAGARVAVTGRTGLQVEAAAREIGAIGIAGDISREEDVTRMVAETERAFGSIDLLVANAGIGDGERAPIEEVVPAEWWHVFQVNVLGTFLCCRAVLPGMFERGEGRIVIVGSGASYLPVRPGAYAESYGPSKAAVGRFAEYLAAEAGPRGVAVFLISPGLVKTDMTSRFSDDAPWTPPELAPRLIRVLASGRADRLAGRYLHAEHDDVEQLIERAGEIERDDLNAIRLRR